MSLRVRYLKLVGDMGSMLVAFESVRYLQLLGDIQFHRLVAFVGENVSAALYPEVVSCTWSIFLYTKDNLYIGDFSL